MIKKMVANFIRGASAIFCEEFVKQYPPSLFVGGNKGARAAGAFDGKRPSPLDMLLLDSLRNRHLGKRCFIVGNGPSLTVEDLDKLRFEYTLASNKIFLAFDETEWRPTYYSCEDFRVMKQNHEKIGTLDRTTKIFPNHMLPYMKQMQNCYFTKFIPAPTRLDPKADPDDRNFSYDLTRGIHWGSTITYALIQIAVFMGFKDIYLIGVDHFYTTPQKLVDGQYVSEGEVNHFHKDYRKPGEEWSDPRVDVLEVSYRHARKACEQIGVNIYNASRKTALNAYECVDLDDVLNR